MLQIWCNLSAEEGSSNQIAILIEANKEEIFLLVIAMQNNAFFKPEVGLIPTRVSL